MKLIAAVELQELFGAHLGKSIRDTCDRNLRTVHGKRKKGGFIVRRAYNIESVLKLLHQRRDLPKSNLGKPRWVDHYDEVVAALTKFDS